MFTPAGLFKAIPCPAKENCQALNCIYSHEAMLQPSSGESASIGSALAAMREDGPEQKRRKLESRAEPIVSVAGPGLTAGQRAYTAAPLESRSPLSRSIPPSTNPVKHDAPVISEKGSNNPTSVKAETLNPRMLPRPPAKHAVRIAALQQLHGQFTRLNTLARQSIVPSVRSSVLSDQQIIKMSLDEEEQLAGGPRSAVYRQSIMSMVSRWKKTDLLTWAKYVDEKKNGISGEARTSARTASEATPKASVDFTSGLEAEQDVALLERLIIPHGELVKLEHVIEIPTHAAIRAATEAIQRRNNVERCDRCSSQFQVWSERREADGMLTTNAPCRYHSGKFVLPRRQKGDGKCERERKYECCGGSEGTLGCSDAATHVYKINDVTELARVMPFIHTPSNLNLSRTASGSTCGAITFDCEMGYTTMGMELIRLTAIDWPEGNEVMDVLVRPKGVVLDLHSQYSGVFPKHYAEAVKWAEGGALCPSAMQDDKGKVVRGPLPLMPDPETARAVFCSFISPTTPLIGHSVENDLIAMRLIHTAIVDTSEIYPHQKGRPWRVKLRDLADTYLNRKIQTGGLAGHDSLEDSQATGDLVRLSVKQAWSRLKKEGYAWDGSTLRAPEAR